MSPRVDPFVGLAPYSEQDAEWFFGREQEVELIVANLRAARLTLLYGGSGVGKSSVLLAGVMQRLRRIQDVDREDARALGARRAVALAERPGLAVVMFRDWREAPLPRLAAAIHAAVVEATGNEDLVAWDGEEPFGDRLREQARQVRTVLVVLDQFEEYFMYHPNEDGAGTLAGELPELLDDVDLRVNFLLGLREDALSRLDRFKGRIPDLFGNYLRLRYLERDAAREAIEKPVEHYNETVRAGRPPVKVEPALVEAVLDGVRAGRLALHASADQTLPAPASTRVETPYLQLVMRELWAAGTADGAHEVTVQTLERLEGAAKIVSNHLGKAMAQLSQEDQAVAADVFGFLVTPSRTKIAHTAEDLAVWADRPPEQVARVLRHLAASDRWVLRAVPPTSEDDQERYELYHDVLADAVHDWSSRNQERRRLVETRRNRLRRWRRRGVLGLAWVACAAVAIAIVQRIAGDEAERSRAATARQLAESSRASLDTDPERSVLLGLEAFDRAPSSQAAVAALRDAVMDSRLRAAYPGKCRDGCDALGPDGKPRSTALALPVGPSADVYDPFYGPETPVGDDRSMSVSPNGRTIAIVRRGGVRLWNPASGLARDVAGASRVTRVAFAGVHGRLLLTTRDDEVLVADTRGAARAEPIADHARLVATSTGGRYVATVHGAGHVRIRDLRTGERTSLHPATRVTSLAFNPTDAGELAVGVYRPAPQDRGQGVSLLRWRSGERRYIAAKERFIGPSEAEFRRDGRRLLVTAPGDRTRVYDAAGLDEVRGGAKQLEADARWLGQRLMSVTGNVVNVRQAGWTTALGGHQDPVRDVAVGPDGSKIATGGDDGTARIWDAETGNQLLQLRVAADEAVTQVDFTPNGEFLVTATEGGAVRLWNVAMGSPLAGAMPADAHFGGSESVVGLDRRGQIMTWSAVDGHRLRKGRKLGLSFPWYGHIAPEAGKVAYVDFRRRDKLVIQSITSREKPQRFAWKPFALSADGSSLLLLGARPRVVDLAGDEEPVQLGDKLPARAFEGAISADGRKALVAGRRPAVFDLASPHLPVPLDGARRGGSLSGAFAPDGAQQLVTTGADAVVWDTETGKRLRTLKGHRGPVTSVAYSPDGKWIVTGGLDRTVRLWDSETGRASGVFRGFPDRIEKAELDPTSRYLLVVPWFDVPQVLSCTACLGASELAQTARGFVTRELTAEERREAGLSP